LSLKDQERKKEKSNYERGNTIDGKHKWFKRTYISNRGVHNHGMKQKRTKGRYNMRLF
jgi:hypothetical protein